MDSFYKDAYVREKGRIKKLLEGMPGRVCLTLDRWTSSQGIGYVFVRGQFLDCDWKMHHKLLNVIKEPYPKDSDSTALSHSVAACLSDWGLDDGKLFSVTISETDLSVAAVARLRSLLFSANNNRSHILVGHCLARSLSTTVQDALFSVQGIVKKVRDCVEYAKEHKFIQHFKQHHLSIDNQTQWNTTYEMLLAASNLKQVLSCLSTYDPNYKGAPLLEEDWKQIETLCTYLKPLFDTANLLTTYTAPTTNTFFPYAWKIQLELARAAASEDPFVRTLTWSMRENFDKYWKSSTCCILATAVVMDPRFKMKLVEFCFLNIFGDNELGREFVMMVDDGIHEYFCEYISLTPAEANGQSSIKLEENQGLGEISTELDQYLEESLLPCVPVFDVVGWWKVNRTKYPALSKMACDILSTPVCTVPVGSVFDTVRKEMDSHTCTLSPETVEALMCAIDWLHI